MSQKIILDYAKKISSKLENYWPACDSAYFHGIFLNGGYSVDAFFEKDGMLLKKNLVTYFDLIDCQQPRSIADQKVLMDDLMNMFIEWETAFRKEYDCYFYAVELHMYRENGVSRVRCHFTGDEKKLEDLPGGAHDLHQKYFEKVKATLPKDRG